MERGNKDKGGREKERMTEEREIPYLEKSETCSQWSFMILGKIQEKKNLLISTPGHGAST